MRIMQDVVKIDRFYPVLIEPILWKFQLWP